MSINQEDRATKANRLSQAAYRQWDDASREVLVSFDQGQLSAGILAYIKLHDRDQIAQDEPSVDLYLSIISIAFLNLLDRGALKPVFEITSLGWDAIDAMRKRTGVGADALHKTPPAVVLTPAQILERQVIDDWAKLSGDQVRKKASASREYRLVLESLLNSDVLSKNVKLIQARD